MGETVLRRDISSIAGACASAARSFSPRRSASTATSRNGWRSARSPAASVAVASVLKVPGDDDAVAAVRAHGERFAGEVGASAWNGLAVARLVAPDGAALRRDLVAVLTALGAGPLPRLWMN